MRIHGATLGVGLAFLSVFGINAYLVRVALKTPSHLIETRSPYEESLHYSEVMDAEGRWNRHWGARALQLTCEQGIPTLRWNHPQPAPGLTLKAVSASDPQRDFQETVAASKWQTWKSTRALPAGIWLVSAETSNKELWKTQLHCPR